MHFKAMTFLQGEVNPRVGHEKVLCRNPSCGVLKPSRTLTDVILGLGIGAQQARADEVGMLGFFLAHSLQPPVGLGFSFQSPKRLLNRCLEIDPSTELHQCHLPRAQQHLGRTLRLDDAVRLLPPPPRRDATG